MLLAIDTSTSRASVALVQDNHLLAEHTWDVGQRHSVELLQRLCGLLESRSAAFTDLSAIAVATGPGSFNGVRVALTVAKSLAFTLDIPLAGLATLDVMAWGCAHASGHVWALMEAGRGQVYAARYSTPSCDPARWAPMDGYHILTPSELAERVEGPTLVCAELRQAPQSAVAEALGLSARFTSPLWGRHAEWLAELALARLAAGTSDDPRALEPQYLRRPAITKSAKVALPYTQAERAARQGTELDGEGESRALRR
jgi:tRNA threonylcarbamoyladenosine biosynthesis protein TsaB